MIDILLLNIVDLNLFDATYNKDQFFFHHLKPGRSQATGMKVAAEADVEWGVVLVTDIQLCPSKTRLGKLQRLKDTTDVMR